MINGQVTTGVMYRGIGVGTVGCVLAISGLLGQGWMSGFSPQVGLALIGATGILAVWVANQLRPLMALTVISVSAAAWMGYSVFGYGQFWLEALSIPITGLMGFGMTWGEQVTRGQLDKRKMETTFSPKVATAIVRGRSQDTLNMTRRRVTILCSNIRGLNAAVEKMTPKEVGMFLREYHSTMTRVVFKHRGMVDQYMGNAIHALYNVPFDQPNHAFKAVQTALEFQKRFRPLAEQFHDKYGYSLSCSVGIHTGDVVVGTLGTNNRFDYKAVGDTINVGICLEGLTKDLGNPIVISESTFVSQAISGICRTRYIDEVNVTGESHPIKLYTVLDEEGRRDPRFIVEGDVEVKHEGVLGTAQISNLSRTGIAISQLSIPLDTHDLTTISLSIPSRRQPVSLDGKVVWREEDKAGFLFVSPNFDTQDALEEIVTGEGSQLIMR